MRTVKVLLAAVIVVFLAASITNADAADLEPAQEDKQINNTSVIKQVPLDSKGLGTYQTFNFAFARWGAYIGYDTTFNGYYIKNKRYLQDYKSSKCWPQDHLPTDWVSEVLIDKNNEIAIMPKQQLSLQEGYKFSIKSTGIPNLPLSFELKKNDNIVDHGLLSKPYPNIGACNTYYYSKNIKDSTGATVQKKFPIIAIHFKRISNDVAIIDGVWQISETLQQKCFLSVCPYGTFCKGGECVCPQNQIYCNGKCVPMDNNNCGKCGKTCPAIANGLPGCLSGACGVASCNIGYGDCDKKAANGCEIYLADDINHCGNCGNACTNGQICCNGACVDLNSDHNNCGQCGNTCDGQTCCNGKCVDTKTDSYNCNGCGNICSSCGSCINGECSVIEDQVYVDRVNPDPNAKRYSTIQEAIDNAADCSIINVLYYDGDEERPYEENLLVEGKSLVIKGAGIGKTIIDGGGSASVFEIWNTEASPIKVTLTDMTIRNGRANSANFGNDGGGIVSGGNVELTVKDCDISYNKADSTNTDGGGICARSGTLRVIHCNIHHNNANNRGGGICTLNSAPATIQDSLIEYNTAGKHGGGICNSGPLTLINSKVIENTQDLAGHGCGIYYYGNHGPIPEDSYEVTKNHPCQEDGKKQIWGV